MLYTTDQPRERAFNKRKQARDLREIAATLSLRSHREMFVQHAAHLEAEATRLEEQPPGRAEGAQRGSYD